MKGVLIRNRILEIYEPQRKWTTTRSVDGQIQPDRSNALGEVERSVILFAFFHSSSWRSRKSIKSARSESADSPLSIGATINHWGPHYLEI